MPLVHHTLSVRYILVRILTHPFACYEISIILSSEPEEVFSLIRRIWVLSDSSLSSRSLTHPGFLLTLQCLVSTFTQAMKRARPITKYFPLQPTKEDTEDVHRWLDSSCPHVLLADH